MDHQEIPSEISRKGFSLRRSNSSAKRNNNNETKRKNRHSLGSSFSLKLFRGDKKSESSSSCGSPISSCEVSPPSYYSNTLKTTSTSSNSEETSPSKTKKQNHSSSSSINSTARNLFFSDLPGGYFSLSRRFARSRSVRNSNKNKVTSGSADRRSGDFTLKSPIVSSEFDCNSKFFSQNDLSVSYPSRNLDLPCQGSSQNQINDDSLKNIKACINQEPSASASGSSLFISNEGGVLGGVLAGIRDTMSFNACKDKVKEEVNQCKKSIAVARQNSLTSTSVNRKFSMDTTNSRFSKGRNISSSIEHSINNITNASSQINQKPFNTNCNDESIFQSSEVNIQYPTRVNVQDSNSAGLHHTASDPSCSKDKHDESVKVGIKNRSESAPISIKNTSGPSTIPQDNSSMYNATVNCSHSMTEPYNETKSFGSREAIDKEPSNKLSMKHSIVGDPIWSYSCANSDGRNETCCGKVACGRAEESHACISGDSSPCDSEMVGAEMEHKSSSHPITTVTAMADLWQQNLVSNHSCLFFLLT